MYIGVTCDLRRRKNTHIYGGRLYVRVHDFYWQAARIDATGAALVALERKHIRRHRPAA